MAAHRDKRGRLQTDKAAALDSNRRLNERCRSLEDDAAEVWMELDWSRLVCKVRAAGVSSLAASNDAYRAEADSLREELTGAQGCIVEVEAEVAEVRARLDDAREAERDRREGAEKREDELRGEVRRLEEEFGEVRAELERSGGEARAEAEERTERESALTEALEGMRREKTQVKEVLEEARERLALSEEEAESGREDVSRLGGRATELEAEKDALLSGRGLKSTVQRLQADLEPYVDIFREASEEKAARDRADAENRECFAAACRRIASLESNVV